MITSILSKEKPPRLERDSRWILIQDNLQVTFNRSGDIVLGKIIELKRSDWLNVDKESMINFGGELNLN